MGVYTTAPNGFSITDNEHLKTNIQELINGVDGRIALTEKGAANGVAELDGSGLVPSSQLPSFVDDVEEYADFASLPVTGETGKLYVTLDDDKVFRWTGSVYIEVSPSAVESVNGKQGVVVLDTDDIAEGVTNEYYTDAKVDGRIAAASIDDLSDVDTSTVQPDVDQALVWDGSNWVPSDVAAEGGGGGLTNFISNTNSKLEVDAIGDTDWAAFDDGAVSVPVDGTGGSPANVVAALETTNPLEGLKSLRFEKGAADAQGEGLSVPTESVDIIYHGNIGYGSFYYDTSAANYAGTVGLWLYDITGSVLINILESSNLIPSGKGKFDFSFVIAGDGAVKNDLRLILMETDTNTDAYNLIFDLFKAGPDTLTAEINTTLTEEIDLTGSGDFTGGKILVSRTENIVSITSIEELTHSSSTSATSASSVLPDWAIPDIPKSNVFRLTAVSYMFRANTNGSVDLSYRNNSFSSTNGITDEQGATLSYVVSSSIGNSTTGLVRNSQLQFEEKILSANVTTNTTVSDLTVSNLVVGRRYHVSGVARIEADGGDRDAVLIANHDGLIVGQASVGSGSTSNDIRAYPNLSFSFLATTDTLTFDTSSFSGSSNLQGNGTKSASFIQVQEVPLTQTAIVQQNKVATIKDVKPANTQGGGSVSGSQDRVLNTLDDPFNLIGSLSSNEFNFSSTGKYFIKARAPAYKVARHSLRFTLSDNTILLTGDSALSGSADGTVTHAELSGYFDVTNVNQLYKIRHYTQNIVAINGLGVDVNNASVDEIYTTVEIWKIGE